VDGLGDRAPPEHRPQTVRTWMKAEDWRPYEREVRTPTQLDAHTAWLRARAPEVNYRRGFCSRSCGAIALRWRL